ncbi:hypothetical protein [Anaerotruncus massiliensis (ex Togo et al. 2019)]|uniref:InlB B-repeat-containing protein n=1 Tax=Anaerotruncus massiliensis (ex Togo et al. 2019) TaxID=1673720 RepID=UPI0027B97F31|nr:hypothetical protein [Anaerotruncus massiliensis (ex Togo et al. 2019)]
MKKLLSICLAVLVVVGLMPVYALADDGDPVGDPTGGSDMTVYTVNAAATGGSISISSATPDAVTGAGPWTVAAGTVINVTATADEGYESVPTTLTATMGGQTTDITGPFAVSGNVSIHATFEKKETNEIVTGAPEPRATTHTVNIPAPSNGSIEVKVDGNTISNGASVEEGKTLFITAMPANGYELEEISVLVPITGGLTTDKTSQTSPMSYVVGQKELTIAATFKKTTATDVTVTINKTGDGTVAVTDVGTNAAVANGGTVAQGNNIKIVVTPNAGSKITAFSIDSADQTPITDTGMTVGSYQANSNVTINVTFSEITQENRTITIDSKGTGTGTIAVTDIDDNNKSITNGATVPNGHKIKVVATPASDSLLKSFSVGAATPDLKDGKQAVTVDNYEVNENITVSATFDLVPVAATHAVKWKAGSNGTIKVTVNGTEIKSGDQVAEGSKFTVTATPDNGYVLDKLTVTGATQDGDTSTYTVGTSDVDISATFKYNGGTSAPSYVYRPIGVYDDDGDWLEDNSGSSFPRPSSDGKVVLDGVLPNQTFYIKLGDAGNDYVTELSGGGKARASQLVDDNLFKISVDKDGDGKSLISKIEQVEEKRLGGMTRASYLKVTLKDMTSTDERKANAEIEFKAKKDKDGSWKKGETAILNLNMWISNKKVSGSDGDADTGEKIYFSPEANENNVLIWGDDRAALEFTADDDAKDFYARLSTKSMSDIYSEYGDPVDADLWFYDFVGNPSIPSTSRAYLTLGIPWDDDDDYTPNPHDVYIYRLDKDGYLEDVTAMFTYSEDDREIEGWTTRTRTLGTYIVSDTELDIDSYYDDDDDTEVPSIDVSNNQKPVPNTGR